MESLCKWISGPRGLRNFFGRNTSRYMDAIILSTCTWTRMAFSPDNLLSLDDTFCETSFDIAVCMVYNLAKRMKTSKNGGVLKLFFK